MTDILSEPLRSSWGLVLAAHDLGALFVILVLACLAFAAVAFWRGLIAAGVGLTFLAVVVSVLFLL